MGDSIEDEKPARNPSCITVDLPITTSAEAAYRHIVEARRAMLSYIESHQMIFGRPPGALTAAATQLAEALTSLLPGRPLQPDEQETDR